jgi:predicted dehydrogenase
LILKPRILENSGAGGTQVGLRIGVIGTGKLGREHVRVLKRVPEVDHVACYDIVPERSRAVGEAFDADVYTDVKKLLEAVDAVSIVVPTTSHIEVSLQALASGRNLFVEKPIAASVDEASRIIEAARETGRVLQIGHIERFNAAVRQAVPKIDDPEFIEIHRLAPFTVRGIDVSVIMDLMIHDIDLLAMFMGEKPVDIRAKGAGILTNGPDIVNARLEFSNGCVANLTASRVSIEPMRKVRVFCPRSYTSIDLLKRSVRHLEKDSSFDESVRKLQAGELDVEGLSLGDVLKINESQTDGEEPLYEELRSFCRTITNGDAPVVSGEDGLLALEIASEIQDIVESRGGLAGRGA